FLGFATAAKGDGTFRFLMLDDPSQSLGSEHQNQLARLLDQVARQKRLIVATMDNEFHDGLNTNDALRANRPDSSDELGSSNELGPHGAARRVSTATLAIPRLAK